MWNQLNFNSRAAREYMQLGYRHVSVNLYRSRDTLNANLIRQTAACVFYPPSSLLVTSEQYRQAPALYITSRCISSSWSPADVRMDAQSYASHRVVLLTDIAVEVVRIYNHARGDLETYKSFFDESEHWEACDYRTALTMHVHHKLAVYKSVLGPNGDTTVSGGHKYVIFTTDYNMNFILKSLAVIAYDTATYTLPELVASLLELDSDKFQEFYLAAAAETYDKQQQHIRIATYEKIKTIPITDMSNRIQSEINNLLNKVEELERRLEDTYNVIYTKRKEILFAKTLNNPMQEFVEHLQKYEDANILFIDANNNTLNVVLRTPLLYWSTQEFNALKTSSRVNAYNNAPDWERQLFVDIFERKTCTLYIEQGIMMPWGMSTNFMLNTLAGHVVTQGVPNPHLQYYNCWGENKQTVLSCITAAEYIQAFTAIKATVAGINILDTTVFSRFAEVLRSSNLKEVPCLEIKETKELITVADYERRYRV